METEQEPVAWLKTWSDGSVSVLKSKSGAFADHELEPLYAAPQKREWVGLTDEEVSYFEYQATFCDELDTALMAELIEQALKKKNNGRYRNRTTTERTKLKEKNT